LIPCKEANVRCSVSLRSPPTVPRRLGPRMRDRAAGARSPRIWRVASKKPFDPKLEALIGAIRYVHVPANSPFTGLSIPVASASATLLVRVSDPARRLRCMGFVQLTDEETTRAEVRGTTLGVPVGATRSFKHQFKVLSDLRLLKRRARVLLHWSSNDTTDQRAGDMSG
jgi:hypothetical protein